MNIENQDPLIPDQIRTLLENWSLAVRNKDLDAIMAAYHPDVVAFDAIIELQFKGRDAYSKHWAHCLNLCPGEMLFEQRDLVVQGAGNVAFAHWLNHCGATDANGVIQGSWMRGSAGYLRTPDGWKIVHEHFSAPFDMASGKALFDLQP
ncbi:nuclear transport factor 2 family protein [Pseudomonas sp. LJDD11]|uniref:YybH family protein n=1 Tax=unclassified Pseudomonas TaxID=196821 RepID=UPI0004F7F0E5|nr:MULTISPECIES: nuclear transport factor 2 family protein [unclassified Pseudomonas]MCO8163485.1 nuclear transport factor 2 family protein [Pseudomonas sp. 21LCFQ010]MCQ9424834.1 nuclear transport factor 2 family protein [Pseudomonas sp. LJDD11]BAP44087.1 putative isomerase [Pseudomonas sp. StFLB209]